MKRFVSVDEYLASGGSWKESLLLLREILSSTELEEEVKWGMPVYTLNNKNVAGFSWPWLKEKKPGKNVWKKSSP